MQARDGRETARACTAHPPHAAQTEVVSAARLGRIVLEELPAELERIVLRCLEKDPRARPAGASELSHELQALGLEALWTEARAREWWRTHHQPPKGGEEASLPEIELTGGDTRSEQVDRDRARLKARLRPSA